MLDPLTVFIIAFVGVLAIGLIALMLLFWVERGRDDTKAPTDKRAEIEWLVAENKQLQAENGRLEDELAELRRGLEALGEAWE